MRNNRGPRTEPSIIKKSHIVLYYDDNIRKALRDFQKYHFGSKSIHRAILCRML